MTRFMDYWAIENDKDSLISSLADMISIPTVNPPGLNYHKMADYLRKKAQSLGIDTKMITPKTQTDRVSVILRWDMGSKNTFHINYHYDVVPASLKWNTDPFIPLIKDGKVFGRGAEDSKGNIASLFHTLSSIKKMGLKPSSNLEISFTPDEESGGRAGFGYLVKNKIINPDFALGEGHSRNYICNGNKGGIRVEVEVMGKSCHASTPYLGRNAFEDMLVIANRLKTLERMISKRSTKHNTKDRREKFATMVMGGKLQGTDTANAVPSRVVFSIDRRVLPEENMKDAYNEIIMLIKDIKKNYGIKINVKTQMIENPVYVNEKQHICKVASEGVRLATGKTARFAIVGGLTDLRYLQEKGIACIGYGVDGKSTAHCANEFVYIESLIKTSKVFAYMILNV